MVIKAQLTHGVDPLTPEMTGRSVDIQRMVIYWDKVDSIIRGLDALRDKSTVFLPKFPDETDSNYNFRLSLSKLTNVYRDVLEGLSTKPFEEEVGLVGKDIPDEIREFVENVNGSGTHLSQFAALTFFNGINYSTDWIFIDYPTIEPGRSYSKAEAKALNLRPFWSHVLAINVLEVRHEIIGSEEVLSYIRIQEPNLEGSVTKIRTFERTARGVVWKVYESPAAGGFVVTSEGVLSIDVIPFVPFITGRRDGATWQFFPAMQDAADLQITLYQNESALEYTKAMSAYPMLAANGMKPEIDPATKQPKPVSIGPGRVLYGVPDGAGGHGEWKFIEPAANTLEFLQKNIDKTKQDLRELGRQPLTALSTQLTTTTTAIAAGKAKSAVTAWALSLKDTLENALVITAKWMKIDYDPEVNVYTGFDNVLDDGSDLDTLTKARENGDLSQETYLAELKRRKILSPEFVYLDEVERILKEIPSEDNSLDSPEISKNPLT
jgi:hypothetical protein